MPDPGILEQIGVRVPAAFAGLAGGLVGAWADGRAGFGSWMAYVGAGVLTANWLAEPAIQVLPIKVSEGVAGFIIGTAALSIVRLLIGAVKRWHPELVSKPNGG